MTFQLDDLWGLLVKCGTAECGMETVDRCRGMVGITSNAENCRMWSILGLYPFLILHFTSHILQFHILPIDIWDRYLAD